MMPDDQTKPFVTQLNDALLRTVIVLIAGLAMCLAGATVLGAVGALPMLTLYSDLGGQAVDAGPILQIVVAVLLLGLLALAPGTLRIRRLEAAHRDFRVKMEDVSRAYWAAHAADRTGVFQLSREFDAVRERYEFLRRHPDLGDLDPEILELSAQMSTEARDLARIYSDEKVAHAESVLAERRAEAERLIDLIERAHDVSRNLRRALEDVSLEEDVVRSRVTMLEEDLKEIWAELAPEAPAGETQRKLRLAAE